MNEWGVFLARRSVQHLVIIWMHYMMYFIFPARGYKPTIQSINQSINQSIYLHIIPTI